MRGEGINRRLGPTVISIDQRNGIMDLIDNGHTIQITNMVEVHIEVDDEQFERSDHVTVITFALPPSLNREREEDRHHDHDSLDQ